MEVKHKGTYNEMLATTWLLKNGYVVFRNVAYHGPVDLIAMQGSTVILIDVKQGQVTNGQRLRKPLEREQVAMGVKALVVYPGDVCILDMNPIARKRHEPELRICKACGREFTSNTPTGAFCARRCQQKHNQTTHRAKLALPQATNGL